MNRDSQSTPTLSRPEDETPDSIDHPYRWSGRIVASIIDSFMGSLEPVSYTHLRAHET